MLGENRNIEYLVGRGPRILWFNHSCQQHGLVTTAQHPVWLNLKCPVLENPTLPWGDCCHYEIGNMQSDSFYKGSLGYPEQRSTGISVETFLKKCLLFHVHVHIETLLIILVFTLAWGKREYPSQSTKLYIPGILKLLNRNYIQKCI